MRGGNIGESLTAIEATLPPRLRIVWSDNLGPRCGCKKPVMLTKYTILIRVGRKHRLGEAVECQRCGAGWEWGEACATGRP